MTIDPRAIAIVGVGDTDYAADFAHAKAGEKPADSYGYAALAFSRALADAGLVRDDVDGLIVGPTIAQERTGEILGLDVRWGGQADAMTAVLEAAVAISTGRAETIALVYGNDQRTAGTAYGGAEAMGGGAFLSYVYHAPWGFTSQGALYALMWRRFMEVHGLTEADLGQVAVAQRIGASLNPNALMRKRITIEDYLASKYICEPLHLLDYCLINDGGVSLIITTAERAARMQNARPVYIHGLGRFDLNRGATSLEPRLTEFYRPAQRRAGDDAWNMAGVGPRDMSCLQIYDSFSPHIPLALEGYGYCGYGEAGRFMRDTGISLERGVPVNTSGGHLSESYMQGWGHQVESVRQLRGICGERQVPDCNFVHYSSDVAGKAVSIIYGR
jgi:acetyl-CoA acetyltransferase